MDEEQVVSKWMVAGLICAIIFGLLAMVAENLPFTLVLTIFLIGTGSGFLSEACKSAKRFFNSYGVMFFLWVIFCLISEGFVCGALLLLTFKCAQSAISSQLQLEKRQSKAKNANRHKYHRKRRRKRRKDLRDY